MYGTEYTLWENGQREDTLATQTQNAPFRNHNAQSVLLNVKTKLLMSESEDTDTLAIENTD